jgi:hypothetical protein
MSQQMINAEAEQDTLASVAGVAFERYRIGQSEAPADPVSMLTPILWRAVGQRSRPGLVSRETSGVCGSRYSMGAMS